MCIYTFIVYLFVAQLYTNWAWFLKELNYRSYPISIAEFGDTADSPLEKVEMFQLDTYFISETKDYTIGLVQLVSCFLTPPGYRSS